jgi:hypothetical protein
MYDCNRQPVSNDTDNSARIAAGLPLFVSNRIGLTSNPQAAINGIVPITQSLTCQGNGSDTARAVPVVQGVEDLVIRYGVSPGGLTQSPTEFTNAAGVAAVSISSDGLSPWDRVTAVSVCIVVRSAEKIRVSGRPDTARSYANCRGGTTQVPSEFGYAHRRFERIYAIRNHLK